MRDVRGVLIILGATILLLLSSLSGVGGELAVVAATGLDAPSAVPAAAETNGMAIRPFGARVPEAQLAELRRRLRATQWPDMETVADRSQGGAQ
jgi:hypothetical protein